MMSTSTPQDLILAAHTHGLPNMLETTGFHPLKHESILSALWEAGLWIGPRDALEQLETFKQIIPYIIVCVGSRFILYKRTQSGGEARLHERMSIGLGGHIDFSDIIRTGGDINLPETLEAAAHRELAEELGELDCLSRSWIGGIVDNETSVGRVHVGIVGLWSIPTFPDGMQEDTIGQICLKSIDELNSIDDHLETWSAMLLPHLQNIMTENSIEP